jgi:hypothetical protein
MKPLIFALCVGVGSLSAQKPVWQPSPGHSQIPIWPGAAPNPQPIAGPEYAETSGKDLFPGVTRPTLTVYSPKGKNTGAGGRVSWRGLSHASHWDGGQDPRDSVFRLPIDSWRIGWPWANNI